MTDRKTFIGGSDIAAVMGLSRWKTPLRLWAEKTGALEPEDLTNVERVEIGLELEAFVARKFQKKTGFKVRRDQRDLAHPKYPYMAVHLDYLVLDGESILECKTTSAWNEKEWGGEDVPQEYILQVMWGLGISKRERGYIAVLIGGQKFVWKEVRFDQDLFDKMVEAARNFWENHVLADVPPVAMADDNQTLYALFPESTGPGLVFEGVEAEEVDAMIEERTAGIQVKDDAEVEIKAIEAKLKQKLGSAESCETKFHRVTWKTIQKQEYVVKAQTYRQLRTFKKKQETTS